MECVQCEEVITNPLCPGCLYEGMEQWLLEQRQEDTLDLLRTLTASVTEQGDVSCIKCCRPMNLCTYCFTRDVMPFFMNDPRLMAQYLTYFNFDLGHLGWEQEALAYLEGEYET